MIAWRCLRYSPRNIRSLATVAVAALLLLLFFRLPSLAKRRYDTWDWTSCSSRASPFDQSCASPRTELAQNMQVVVRTGGSEPQARLRHQLATTLFQVPRQNLLIFSDLEEEVDTYRVHDLYADISERERAIYPEFTLYDAQQQYKQQGKDTRELQGGWKLGKYMNLAMKRKLWEMQQKEGDESATRMKWFVFLDTDTFVQWENLLGLLDHLDSEKPFYLGSPVWLPGLEFAHGGSAYVLSYGALKVLNSPTSDDQTGPFSSQYGLNVTALCCGDEAVARVLKSKDVKLKGYWPMFNGETPATVSFSDEVWCEPVISLHHLEGEEMQSLWDWAADWQTSTRGTRPLLYKDLFRYIAPQISSVREDWDNTHGDMKVYQSSESSRESFENCRTTCEDNKSCLQFVYDGATCALSYSMRLGRQRLPEGDGTRRFMSGWNKERISDWATEKGCTSAHWVKSNP